MLKYKEKRSLRPEGPRTGWCSWERAVKQAPSPPARESGVALKAPPAGSRAEPQKI